MRYSESRAGNERETMDFPGYRVVEDGLFFPSGAISCHDVIYDAEYRLVPESCVIRGKVNPENVSRAPEYLPDAFRRKLERRRLSHQQKRMLFLGTFVGKHYGHLLTEGIARYWYLIGRPDHGARIPAPYNPFGLRAHLEDLLKPQQSHWKAFLPVFGIGSDQILVTREPVYASEIIVPNPSMQNRGQISPAHLAVTKRLAVHLIRSAEIARDEAPVYLSRSKFRKRGKKQYLGEVAIEDYCKGHGCRIVYPEQLSLKEQIILFNTHDTFIGFSGSAFHSVMFRLVDRRATNIYLLDSAENSNFQLIDGLMKNSAHYIPCVEELAGERVWKVSYEKAAERLGALMRWV